MVMKPEIFLQNQIQDLIDEATEQKKWIFDSYNQQWYSPKELEGEIHHGHCLHELLWFSLEDPLDLIKKTEQNMQKAKADYLATVKRVYGY
jgi:hypothetical protein